MSTKPDLRFGPDVSESGFTPAGISAYSDLRAAAVVRELIQNSLDAALIEANEKCAKVRFRKFTCKVAEIPGIKSYRAAFQRAIDAQTLSGKQTMSSQARLVKDRIEGALGETVQSVLSVTDNGVGLDERKMSALLSDGVSAKGDKAAGTYGNGHSVAIPASNLRYVLYGGLAKGGAALASGHAVLASHRVPDETYGRSAHGLYIKSFDSPVEGVPYTFPRGSAAPPLIASEIDQIRSNYGHGTAVIIPAFNHFEDKDLSLWEIVARAAACNFFQAIHTGQLIVEVEEPSEDGKGLVHEVLNATTLLAVLQQYQSETRIGRRGAFLSGRKAYEAYQTLVNGECQSVKTSFGDVSIALQRRNDGKPGVGLCRNGMWISDTLPRFRDQFNDRQPFQALILLDPDRRNELYGLVQEAETPLHNDLALKPMSKNRRQELGKALVEIRDWIRSNVPEIQTESYSPEDILAFQFKGVEARGAGGNQRSFWGTPATTAKQTPPGTDKNIISENVTLVPEEERGVPSYRKPKNKERVRRAAAPYFQIASIPGGPDKQRIFVECEQECVNAELRIVVDENVDATCDSQLPSQVAPLLLSDVSVDGKPVAASALIEGEKGIVGIDLGNLSASSEILVETRYEIPDGAVCVMPGYNPALRIEIVSRAEVMQPSSSDDTATGNTSDA